MWKGALYGCLAIILVPILLLWGIFGYIFSRSIHFASALSFVLVLGITIGCYTQAKLSAFEYPVSLAFVLIMFTIYPKKALLQISLVVLYISFAVVRRLCPLDTALQNSGMSMLRAMESIPLNNM
jgi:hypothetical protein